MSPRVRFRRIALALLMYGVFAGPAQADVTQRKLFDMIERLNARVDALEKRNAELERMLANPVGSEALDRRVSAIETQNAHVASALDSDRISEHDPDLVSRLKAVEMQTASMHKAAAKIDALDGVSAGMSLTTVVQKASTAMPSGERNSEIGYRGDITVNLPLGEIGNAANTFFAHLRMGQNAGLNALPTYAAPNAVAFRALATQPEDSAPILAEAWFQTAIPLPFGGIAQHSREKLELNFGKMDPFVFFDQNAAANDESRQFLNSAFVHNPLLDAGGDIGVDANGFSPGMRLSYLDKQSKQEPWRLSLGVFASGTDAHYARAFSSHVLIAQAEMQRRLFDGQAGNYRLYAWRNNGAEDYAGAAGTHTGWGVSADQRIGDAITVFGRYGHQASGRVRFDRALTLGAEIGGNGWDRSADAIGIAAGRLRTSRDFARDSATVDADGDGVPDYGYAAGRAERIVELYYRYRIGKQIELAPDFQVIGTPGGNPAASTIRIGGLRLQLSY